MLTRRQFTLGSLAVGAGLAASLKPVHAHYTPKVPGWQTIEVSPNHSSTALFAEPPHGRLPAPAVLVVHNHFGLSGSIKWITAELGRQGYLALAPNLYGDKEAESEEEGLERWKKLDQKVALSDINAWYDWIKQAQHCNGHIGLLSWSYGAEIGVEALKSREIDAGIFYYPELKPKQILPTNVPIIAHMAGDQPLLPAQPNLMQMSHGAKRGFADLFGPNFNPDEDLKAWDRTLNRLREKLQRT